MNPATTPDPKRWIALGLLVVTQFMIVLDVAIVNVALPSIQTDLHFSQENLQWVVSAYTLAFGGFLLLGGRAGDLLGRRRVFIAGLSLFSAASLACGLSTSDEMLIAARAIQGLGAAIVAPAALSILTTTFDEGAERNKALGIWGAVSGMGGAAGVLAGGVLTDSLSWEWIFLVNVPIGIAAVALAPVLLRESRIVGAKRNFDLAGAITVTSGLVLLVFGLVKTTDYGWTSGRTLGALAGAALLLALFVVVEARSKAPLVPLGIFRRPTLTGSNVVGFLIGAAIFSMFFFLSLYMQQVLGYSAMKTGVAYLAVALSIIIAAGVAQALVTKIGVRTVLASGLALSVVGLLWFTQVSVGGSYWVDLLPGFIISGVGLGFAFVPVTIAAVEGVSEREAGVASGLINTSQQIGGALGVAVLSTLATTRTEDYLQVHPGAVADGLVDGFGAAFAVGAGMAVLGLLATLLLIRNPAKAPAETPAEALEPALAEAE